jgi:peroxiredoxin/Sec-independent protein translocase protein TatA
MVTRLEASIMKRWIIFVTVVLVVLGAARAQETRTGAREGRQGFQNLSDEERAKMKERFQNMSPEEREKFRAEMRQRIGSGGRSLGPEEQLKAIEAIEEQVAKLKAAVEAAGPGDSERLRDLSEAERAKLREKMGSAMRQRQQAIRAIEGQLARLRGPAQQTRFEPRESVGQLKAIHELAVKENATQTAKRLEKLIASYQRQPTDRMRDPEQRPPRDRLVRPEKVKDSDSSKKAPGFKLNSFEGKTVSLSDYRGKIVVLEWLNFECPYVRYHYDKVTTMIDLAKKYKDRNVVWLAVNSTSHTTPGANIEFAEKHKLPYPILDDRSGKVGHAYGAETTPHMFVIDPRGNIVYEGAIDNSPNGKTPAGQELTNYVDAALTAMIAGKDVSTRNTRPYGCSVKYPR